MDGGELTLASYFVTGNGAFVGVWWKSRGMGEQGRRSGRGGKGGGWLDGRGESEVVARRGWLAGVDGNLQAEARDWILL